MPNLGPTELILILLIVVVVFGAGKLSEIGGALGKGIREFRNATKDENKDETASPMANTSSTSATAAPTSNTCPSCGTVNPTSQAFCGQCGTRLSKAA
jgi:sec-independent protein translocase protein TatA